MSRKSKGINAERDLVHRFNKAGWVSARIAGSGSMKYPSPDVIAGNNLKKLVIECKTISSESKYLTKEEIDELNLFADTFGAEPWIAIKFNKEDWLFLNIEDLKKSEKSYSITLKEARLKGVLFEELIKS